MEKIQKILTPEFIGKLKKIKPDQVIFGEPYHPRKLSHKVDRPEYARSFSPEPHPLCQICYCVKGKCVITINDASFKLLPGDLCFFRRNMSHYESYCAPGQPYELIWLYVWKYLKVHQSIYAKDGRFRVANQQNIRISKESVRQLDQINFLGFEHKKEQWPIVKKMIVEFFTYYQKRNIVVFGRLANKWQAKLVNEVTKYIEQHYAEKIYLKEIAKRFSYSPNYLDALFKKEHGEGIMHYIIYQRLLQASVLLETTHLNVTEIARQCGYDDVCYFSRIFKKSFVVSPTEYRQLYS
jgi:AraC-like DNA-binding protein